MVRALKRAPHAVGDIACVGSKGGPTVLEPGPKLGRCGLFLGSKLPQMDWSFFFVFVAFGFLASWLLGFLAFWLLGFLASWLSDFP